MILQPAALVRRGRGRGEADGARHMLVPGAMTVVDAEVGEDVEVPAGFDLERLDRHPHQGRVGRDHVGQAGRQRAERVPTRGQFIRLAWDPTARRAPGRCYERGWRAATER